MIYAMFSLNEIKYQMLQLWVIVLVPEKLIINNFCPERNCWSLVFNPLVILVPMLIDVSQDGIRSFF